MVDKTKVRTEKEKNNLIKHLNIIEGQVRGIKQMVLDDRYCGDIIIQISAISKSLKSLGNKMLKNHLETCVIENLKNGKLEVIDEVIELFGNLK